MTDFLHFARRLLDDRWTLFWALVFACLAASAMGAGLMSIGPILKVILDPADGRSLAQQAVEYNAAAPQWRQVPDAIVGRLPTEPFQSVLVIVSALAVLTVIGAVLTYAHQALSITVAARTIARTRQEAFGHVVRMPLGLVMMRGPSQLVARIIRDTAELQRGLAAMTSKAVVQVTRGAAAFIVALIVNWRLTLISSIALPILWIIVRKLGKRIRRGMRGALQGQEHLLRIATESLQGLRSVKANTAEEPVISRFDEMNEQVVSQELRARTARAISTPVVEVLAVLAIAGLALIAAREILDGSLEFEEFFLAIGSLAIAGASFRPLVGLVNEMQAASAPAQRIKELLDEPMEELRDPARAAIGPHRKSIEFINVCLTYPGSTRMALDHVSLVIPHSSRTAIVGPNGSGKTTLVSLLPRLLTQDKGKVLIDDLDIARVSLARLRRQIAVVTQETMLFRGTIAENIALGMEGATREQVIAASKQAHAHEFIMRLPGGYDADVLEQGASLSGGQRQRLAIARAILRDPSILILDEATSQIDADSEAHISAAISEFCAGRTAIIIAHRLATVLDADQIIVMDEGRIIDEGTHDELLQRCDLYRALTRTQLVGAA